MIKRNKNKQTNAHRIKTKKVKTLKTNIKKRQNSLKATVDRQLHEGFC